MAYAYIDTVGPDGRLAGFGGFAGLGSAEGDALGTGCLCGGSGVCTTASQQGPAMAKLRAAMRAAGLATSSGNWTVAEQNTLNAFARANGQSASSKFLVDGGPCVALKNALAAPPPPVAPATPITDCASLLANAPPVPPGTPVATVVAVLQSIAGPGFDVTKCMGGAAPPTPVPTPTDVLPPVGVTVPTTPSRSMLPFVLGGVGLLALGGVAFAVSRRGGGKMRKNGTPSRASRPRWQQDEIDEMVGMLARRGYAAPRQWANKFASEGIGPMELADRLRIPPGQMGSVSYSHGVPHPRHAHTVSGGLLRKNGRAIGGHIGGAWSSSRSSWFQMGERVGRNALPEVRASIPQYLPPGAGSLRDIADEKAIGIAIEVGAAQARFTRMSETQRRAFQQGVYATIMRDIVPNARPRKAF